MFPSGERQVPQAVNLFTMYGHAEAHPLGRR